MIRPLARILCPHPSPLPREREQAVLAPFSLGRGVGEEGEGFTQEVYSSSNYEVAVFSIY